MHAGERGNNNPSDSKPVASGLSVNAIDAQTRAK